MSLYIPKTLPEINDSSSCIEDVNQNSSWHPFKVSDKLKQKHFAYLVLDESRIKCQHLTSVYLKSLHRIVAKNRIYYK